MGEGSRWLTGRSTRTRAGTAPRRVWTSLRTAAQRRCVPVNSDVRWQVRYQTLPTTDHRLVKLRPLVAPDIPSWFAYLSDPRVYEHTSWNVRAPEELSHYTSLLASPTPSSMLRLAIAELVTDRLVGTIGFHTVSPENRSAEIAYDLAPAYWGKGIARDMCDAMVGWAHGDAGLNRVQATVLTSNARSIKVLENCGFEREGLLRQYRFVRGSPGDFWMYSHVRRAT